MRIPKIVRGWAVAGMGGWYCDDRRAIATGAEPDGYFYTGAPVTPGFRTVREPGEALLVTLEGEDGSTGEGDCISVTYAGMAGREGPLHAGEHLEALNREVLPALEGRSWGGFREAALDLDALCGEMSLHGAIRYGLSQAVLGLAASAGRCTIAEVICGEYGLPLPSGPVPVGIQTGEDRYRGADKAILKRADVLPHALIKSRDDFGERGENLLEYARRLKGRIVRFGGPGYAPTIHFDVYGSPGRAFGWDVGAMVEFLLELEEATQPYPLQVESPVEMETKRAHVELMARLCEGLREAGARVRIIADEWCNTLDDIRIFAEAGACDMAQIKMPDLGDVADSIEAVLYCKEAGIGAYLGGSCNETALSAQVSVNVALATRPDQVLAKPGMGVDEALMIVRNEMARVLGRIHAKT